MLGKNPPPAPPQDTPTRRFTDAPEANATLVGPGTRIKGELAADGAVDIAGAIEGELRVGGHCRVRQGAHVSGRVEAKTLLIEGTVDGPALVADKIEIGASARVHSNIQARVVAVADGAVFEGRVQMDGSGAPGTAQTFTEKRR
jgi:cytoskeletal protein CcmA (bactofilin family)